MPNDRGAMAMRPLLFLLFCCIGNVSAENQACMDGAAPSYTVSTVSTIDSDQAHARRHSEQFSRVDALLLAIFIPAYSFAIS